MELRDYVKIVGSYVWLLIVVVLIATLGTYFFTLTRAESFDGGMSIYILKKPDKSAGQEFQYDKYYAIQASSLLADSVLSWLKDPSNVIDIYNNANLNLPSEKLSKLSKAINAKKQQPSTINILINGLDEATVRNLLESTRRFVDTKLKISGLSGSTENFEVTYSSVAVLKHTKSLLVNTMLGLTAGLVIGLALVFLVDYFKSDNR